jgi:hypothetical protein
MNPSDPLEERLSALRPGKMPDALLRRLEQAPRPETPRGGRVVRVCFASAAAAAACALLWPRSEQVPAPSAAPVLASARSSRLTEVKPLSVITDAAQRPWKFVQVRWVEEDTLVSAANPSAVQLQDHYATIVPVAVTFD